jgi:hypothetical protein
MNQFRLLRRSIFSLSRRILFSDASAAVAKPRRVPREPFALADRQYRSSLRVQGVSIVADLSTAKLAAFKLLSLPKETVVAWHVEYTDIDTARSTLFDHGKIVSLTAHCGSGELIFIDCWREALHETLAEFAIYFSSASHLKVFHDYHAAAHLLHKHGISLRGLLASTRYLARLVDTSLASWEGKESLAKRMKEEEEDGCY